MKNLLSLLLLTVFASAPGFAQDDSSLDVPENGVPTTYTRDHVSVKVKTKFGVMAQLNPGFTFGMQSNLEKSLDSTFTADYKNNPLGMLLGAHVDVIIGSRLMIGVGGMNLNYNRRIALGPASGTEPELGMAHTNWQFFGARVGAVLINKACYRWNSDKGEYVFNSNFMLYPFAAYHFMGNGKLTIDNYRPQPINFGESSIEPVQSKEYEATQGLIEVGIGTKWTKNPRGGLTFGLELGGYFGMGGTKWSDGGTELARVETANLTGGYLRVTVGGGFLKLR
ncbi:MAG: hypothetical protein KF690_05580 [Bacteroidetes bacterium]|nr:hypothetical protein [Bacteroidota bacterium]